MWRIGLVVGLALMATGCAAPLTDTDVMQRSSWYAPKPPVVVVRQGPVGGGGNTRTEERPRDKPGGKEKTPALMANAITPYEQTITVADGRRLQKALCVVPQSDAFDTNTRDQIMNFKRALLFPTNSIVVGQIVTDADLQNLRQAQQRSPDCTKAGFRDGFEVGLVFRFERAGTPIHGMINNALKTLNITGIPPVSMPAGSVIIDEATRKAIASLAEKYGLKTGSAITGEFYQKLPER